MPHTGKEAEAPAGKGAVLRAEESALSPESFRLDRVEGQNILRFLPEPSFAQARLFMRGPLLDGVNGQLAVLRERLKEHFNAEGFPIGTLPLIAPRQVHGADIFVADNASILAPDAGPLPPDGLPLPSTPILTPDADGILLMTPKVEASLRVADCAPVLVLPSEEWGHRQPWALLLHSGYKGTVLNIARAGLDEVERQMGREAVTGARAWVGPCVSMENYPRAMEDWTRRGLDAFHPENVRERDGHFHFDLAGELRRQFLDCGLDESRIFLSRLDTAASPETCYSYRRGDKTDRMFLHVRLNAVDSPLSHSRWS